jgi:hypothetical protein
MKIIKLVIFKSILLCCYQVTAQVVDCDRLAASPMDIEKNNPGVSFNAINAPLAIPACKQATDLYPNSGRLWFQYGRVLEKGNLLPDAVLAYQRAGNLNHAAAINNLGELYRDGKGVQRDANKARDFFSRSAALGSPEGQQNFSRLNSQITSAQNSAVNEGFMMPSGNIACIFFGGKSIRCDLMNYAALNLVGLNNAYIPISKANCPVGNWGDAFELSQTGRASPLCHGDTIYDPNLPKLNYGSSFTKNNITCQSQSNGLTCKNTSGHGFFINKSAQQFF